MVAAEKTNINDDVNLIWDIKPTFYEEYFCDTFELSKYLIFVVSFRYWKYDYNWTHILQYSATKALHNNHA